MLANLEKSSLGLKDTDTFAQQHKLINRKAHVFRFIWILGNYGEFEKDKITNLVVDAKMYLANRGNEKTLAIWSFVNKVVIKILSEFGVCCERVVSKGVKIEDLTTGTGYLRKKGWVMRISFEEKIGSMDALKALQTYIRKLDKRYGSRAFIRFRKVDMRIFLDI
ncbi:hypothetical protein ACFLRN_03640 [Thermoproteota archaeon]